jgi:hypothetical protein
MDAELSPEHRDWNRRHRKAMSQYVREWLPDGIPLAHIFVPARIIPRARGMFSRKGICAVRVPVRPKEFTDDGGAERAIFSMFEPKSDDSAGADAVALSDVVESRNDRFLVEYYFSYDIRGLTDADPNAAAPPKSLSSSELNDAAFAIDFAAGRRLQIQPTVAASSGDAASAAPREFAQAVYQRVKPVDARVIVEVGQLCQPLWAFPWLRDVATAKKMFRTKINKWDAEQWLVASTII